MTTERPSRGDAINVESRGELLTTGCAAIQVISIRANPPICRLRLPNTVRQYDSWHYVANAAYVLTMLFAVGDTVSISYRF